MSWNYIILIFICCFVFSIIAYVMSNNHMHQIVHTTELIFSLIAIVFYMKHIDNVFVFSCLVFFLWRTFIRLVDDCVVATKKENKKGEVI